MSVLALAIIACLSLSAVDGYTNNCDGKEMRILGNEKREVSRGTASWRSSQGLKVFCKAGQIEYSSENDRFRRAAELLEEAHQLIPSIELAELLGGERQLGTDEFMGLLDEIAKIVGVDKI